MRSNYASGVAPESLTAEIRRLEASMDATWKRLQMDQPLTEATLATATEQARVDEEAAKDAVSEIQNLRKDAARSHPGEVTMTIAPEENPRHRQRTGGSHLYYYLKVF